MNTNIVMMTVATTTAAIVKRKSKLMPNMAGSIAYVKFTTFELTVENVLSKYNVYAPDCCAANSNVVQRVLDNLVAICYIYWHSCGR
jgi:hypothetical protein